MVIFNILIHIKPTIKRLLINPKLHLTFISIEMSEKSRVKTPSNPFIVEVARNSDGKEYFIRPDPKHDFR